MPFSNNMNTFPSARALSPMENKESLEEGESSFRVYYGTKGAAIPFVWESQPGTPKHPMFCDKNVNLLPPLTPPPSYTLREDPSESSKKERKHIVFRRLFSSIMRKGRSHVTPTWSLNSNLNSNSNSNSSPFSTLSSSSTSSSSSRSSPQRKCNKSHRRSFSFSTPMEKLTLFNKEGQNNVDSSTCFGFKKQQGCYSMQDMKNAVFLKRH